MVAAHVSSSYYLDVKQRVTPRAVNHIVVNLVLIPSVKISPCEFVNLAARENRSSNNHVAERTPLSSSHHCNFVLRILLFPSLSRSLNSQGRPWRSGRKSMQRAPSKDAGSCSKKASLSMLLLSLQHFLMGPLVYLPFKRPRMILLFTGFSLLQVLLHPFFKDDCDTLMMQFIFSPCVDSRLSCTGLHSPRSCPCTLAYTQDCQLVMLHFSILTCSHIALTFRKPM